MRNLDEYRDWQGTIDDLVDTANIALQRLGRGRNADLNIRLVRDYAQRGILSPAERRGKEAVYRFQHLNEIIAARVLLNDGWPLAKIAEQFQTDRKQQAFRTNKPFVIWNGAHSSARSGNTISDVFSRGARPKVKNWSKWLRTSLRDALPE